MLKYVYRRAEAKGKIVRASLGPHRFEYALIFTSDGYGQPWRDEPYANALTTYWLRKDINKGAGGINIPGYAFVFGSNIPEPFRDYVGLHEHHESQGFSHIKACMVELSEARRNGEFYGKYASWLHGLALKPKRGKDRTVGYFDRALPGFTAKYNPNKYLATQYVDIFYRLISA
ncbi:MAG: hypothetical protein NT099_03855 [Candidatus Saganbacteria bacterium]|nr:hypothetical protein [Candidatus Saganbacteria bacterium]